MNKLFLLSLSFLFLPSFAYAFSHTYTCADFALGGLSTCSGDVWTDNSPTTDYIIDYIPNVNVTPYPDIYVSFDYAKISGTSFNLSCAADVSGDCSPNPNSFSGAGHISEYHLNTTTAHVNAGLFFDFRGGLWYGSLSNICVDDDGSSCSVAPPPPPPTPSIADQLASTTPLFYAVGGFDMNAFASTTGTGMIKLVLGNTLAMVYGLRVWIVALLAVGATLAVTYRAFRFFTV